MVNQIQYIVEMLQMVNVYLINKTEYQAIAQELRERFMELNSTKYITDFGPQDPKCCEQIQKPARPLDRLLFIKDLEKWQCK